VHDAETRPAPLLWPAVGEAPTEEETPWRAPPPPPIRLHVCPDTSYGPVPQPDEMPGEYLSEKLSLSDGHGGGAALSSVVMHLYAAPSHFPSNTAPPLFPACYHYQAEWNEDDAAAHGWLKQWDSRDANAVCAVCKPAKAVARAWILGPPGDDRYMAIV
jgi:hypothetical protein